MSAAPASASLRSELPSEDEWGFLFRSGLRWMPEVSWMNDRVEIFGSTQVSNQNLVDNTIAFEIGGRYDITEWLALSLQGQFDTDSFAGFRGGLRFYWWELVNQLRGRDPNENLPWIKNASSAPGPQNGAN